MLAALRRAAPPGVKFTGVTFRPRTPGDGKYADTLVTGIRLTTTDRGIYDPTVTAVHLLTVLRAVHPQAFAFRPAQFDRLAGGPELREAVERGEAAATSRADGVRRWPDSRSGGGSSCCMRNRLHRRVRTPIQRHWFQLP